MNNLNSGEIFFELHVISEKKFNPKQISYLLFLDVVKLLSTGNQRQKRYSEGVNQFWRIGMKLFHGKFLRFVSGERSVMHYSSPATGEVLRKSQQRSIAQYPSQ